MANRAWLVLVLSTASACGSDSVSIGGYAAAYIDAYCAQQVRCGSQATVAECKATEMLNNSTFMTTLDAVENGTIKYDGEQASSCIDEIKDGTCAFTGFQSGDDSACTEVFEGTVAIGGACASSVQCAGEAGCQQTDQNCDRDMMCCPGTCAAFAVPAAIGQSCATTSCVDGAYCNGSDVCVALITTSGTACDSFVACANPMICNIFSNMPVCEAPAASGATCNPDHLLPCLDFRDFCDTGMKCSRSVDVGGACPNGDECVSFATCVSGTCQKDSGVGGTCSDQGLDCLGSLTCTSGTCQVEPAGTSCL